MPWIVRTLCLSVVIVLTLLRKDDLLEARDERHNHQSGLESLPKDDDKAPMSESVNLVGPEVRNDESPSLSGVPGPEGAGLDNSEYNATESDGSESNDNTGNHIDPGSNDPELRSDDTDSKSEQDETKESESRVTDSESEDIDDEGGDSKKPFLQGIYYKILTGFFYSIGVVIQFISKSNSIIQNYFKEKWEQISNSITQYFKENWDRISQYVKENWDRISQDIIDFLAAYTLEVFIVVVIIISWSCCFHIHVCRKIKEKKKEKKKEKEKATVIANLLADTDLENASEDLSMEEITAEDTKTVDTLMAEDARTVDTMAEDDETVSTFQTDDDDTVILSNGSAQC